jgi:molecular chaperone GrpE
MSKKHKKQHHNKENEAKNSKKSEQEQKVEETQEQNSLEDELKKCQEELANQKNEYLRAYADLENTKKRLEKDKNNAVAFANEAFAKDLLTVLDTFENALNSIEQIKSSDEESIEKIKEGIKLTYDKLLSVLKKHGVEEVSCDGEFDPNYHQAVMQVESDEHNSGDIVQVLQKGYTLKDRLLRPAMVSSCK